MTIEAKAYDRIKYIGDSFAYGGEYQVIPTEDTYKNPSDCPVRDIGKLIIIEFTNDDMPMFIPIEKLNPVEWQLV